MESKNARVTVTASTGEAVVLTIDGALDAVSSSAAGESLREAVAALPPPSLVVVDLSTVGFFAAAGVHLLAEVANACTRRGLRMRLVVAPESVVARVVRIARLDDLPTYPTLAAALRN
jgi:anti-anti-sigma factor